MVFQILAKLFGADDTKNTKEVTEKKSKFDLSLDSEVSRDFLTEMENDSISENISDTSITEVQNLNSETSLDYGDDLTSDLNSSVNRFNLSDISETSNENLSETSIDNNSESGPEKTSTDILNKINNLISDSETNMNSNLISDSETDMNNMLDTDMVSETSFATITELSGGYKSTGLTQINRTVNDSENFYKGKVTNLINDLENLLKKDN